MWLLKIIIILFFMSSISCQINEDNKVYKDLEKLITDYRDLYHASHIFVARSQSSDDLKVSTTFLRLFKHFSKQNVFSMITSIMEIPKDIAQGKKRPGRPFFIIFISSMLDFNTFSKVTKIINMNVYGILVVFRRNFEFCQKPEGNPFNLVYDARMLIKCEGSPIVREWYSLYPNKTEVFELLSWKPDIAGFTRLTNLSFQERRSSLNGINLRVTLLEDSKSTNGEMIGFFGSIITELSKVAHFKIDLQPCESDTGSYDPLTKKWNGVMEKLKDKKTDIGVGEFTMTVERLDIADFSDPVAISETNFYLKEPQEYLLMWSMYYKAYGWKACYCLLLFFLISPIIISLTMIGTSEMSFCTNVYDNYFQVWGIFSYTSVTGCPENVPSRIAYYSLFILAFILYSTYSALLVSYLTIFKPDLPFYSINEFINSKTHRITTVKSSSFMDAFMITDDPLMKQLNKFLLEEKELPHTLSTALEQVCNDEKKVILYMDEKILRGNRFTSPCKLIPFEPDGLSNLAFAFVKDSPYVKLINYHLRRMRDTGLLNIVESRNVKKLTYPPIVYKSVNFRSTIPIFGILYIGMLLSVVILVFENIFHRTYNKEKRNSKGK